jgi:hypothetical protein
MNMNMNMNTNTNTNTRAHEHEHDISRISVCGRDELRIVRVYSIR